jgi:hypothetical protein
MTMFSIPYQSNGKNAFYDFTIERDCVLFAGSRHLSVNRQVCNDLINRFGKLGFSFVTGCAKGVDESFRLALADTDYKDLTTVACAFESKVKKYLGAFKLYAVSKTLPPRTALAKRTLWMTSHCSMLVLFPSVPIGKGSALAFKSAVKNKKPVFIAVDKKPTESKYYRVFKSSLFGVVNGYWCIPTSLKEAVS